MIRLTTILTELEDLKYDLDNDLSITLGFSLPGDGGHVSNMKTWVKKSKKSTNKDGSITYDITLKDGTKMMATKVDKWRGSWIFKVDGKTFNTHPHGRDEITSYFRHKYLSDIEQLEVELKAKDWYWHMADDSRTYKRGKNHNKYVSDLMDKIKKQGLGKEAIELWNKYAPKELKRK